MVLNADNNDADNAAGAHMMLNDVNAMANLEFEPHDFHMCSMLFISCSLCVRM